MADTVPPDLDAIRFSYFPSIFKPAQTSIITLSQAIDEIRGPRHKATTEILRMLLEQGKKDEYDRQKRRLPATTFGGTFSYREIDGLLRASGLLIQEIDFSPKMPDLPRCEELKYRFLSDPFVVLVFISPSGAGLRLIYRIPVVDSDVSYKRIWAQVSDYVEQTYEIATDKSCKDISRLLFSSWDPHIYVNEHAVHFPSYRGARELIRARAELENMADGQRYFTRNKLGFTLGGHIAAGTLEEGHVVRVLNPIIERTTKHPDKSRKGFWKAVEDGKAKPIKPDLDGEQPRLEMKAAPEIDDSELPPDVEEPPWLERPVICAQPTEITETVDACLEALMAQDGNLYQRDSSMVAVQRCSRAAKYGAQDDGERVRIVPATTKYVQELATRAAQWWIPTRYREGRQHYKPGVAPERIIQHIEARMSLPLRVLNGVTMAPTLRADGRIVDQPGYDPATGLFYAPAANYPEVLTAPTWDDARAAYTALCEPFADFHFAKEHDHSAAIAAVLSIAVRHLVRTVPLFGVSANVRGAGKGLLVSVCSLIATGGDAPKWDEVTDPEEERKRLLVIAMDGDRVTCIDNVTRALGSGPLDRAITEPYMKGRLLGASKSVEVALQTVFFATGNALQYRGDMARRVVPITLSPKVERPEEREDFHHPDLFAWTRDEHPRLLVAALTLLKAYILAGKPKQDIKSYGSFDEWSNLIRSALVWVDADDPCAGREHIEAENDERYGDLVVLFEAWEKCYPIDTETVLKDMIFHIKAALAVEELKRTSKEKESIELGEALKAFDRRASKIEDLDAKRIGRNLRPGPNGTRIINGKRLLASGEERTGVKRWKLVYADADFQHLQG